MLAYVRVARDMGPSLSSRDGRHSRRNPWPGVRVAVLLLAGLRRPAARRDRALGHARIGAGERLRVQGVARLRIGVVAEAAARAVVQWAVGELVEADAEARSRV